MLQVRQDFVLMINLSGRPFFLNSGLLKYTQDKGLEQIDAKQ